jgi:hypothetical protein
LEHGSKPEWKKRIARTVMTKILRAIEVTAKNRVECVAGSAIRGGLRSSRH